MKLCILILWLHLSNGCPNERNCSKCDFSAENPTCQNCFDSAFDPSTKKCVSPPTRGTFNCIQYTKNESDFSCSLCKSGFFLSKAGTCEFCEVDDCAVCDESGKCSACFNYKKPNESGCKGDKKCEDTLCNICSIDSCLECKNGSALNSKGKCVLSLPGCRRLFSDLADKCEDCQFGYMITSNRTCVQNETGYGSFSTILAIFAILAAIILLICIRGSSNSNNEEPSIGGAFMGGTKIGGGNKNADIRNRFKMDDEPISAPILST